MTIALKLLEYLEWKGVDYQFVEHSRTSTSMESAERAHVPGSKLAKGVILEDDEGYVMAVVPANHHVELEKIHQQLNRRLELAPENELSDLFDDCSTGAVPPVGAAYGFETIVDTELKDCADIYFEAGDHTELVHVSGKEFRQLMERATYGHFSQPITSH